MDLAKWKERFPSFAPREVLSPSYLHIFETRGLLYLDLEAMQQLQDFRSFLGSPLYCNHGWLYNRGTRSIEEHLSISKNKAINSFHVLCRAFDLSSDDLSPPELYEAAFDFGFTGIGLYDTFCHVDNRIVANETPWTWDNRSHTLFDAGILRRLTSGAPRPTYSPTDRYSFTIPTTDTDPGA